MAGARVVEEICARPSRDGLAVTVVGAEPHAAYNRILLSEVLAGRHAANAIALTSPDRARLQGVDLRLATPAVVLDPDRRTIRAGDGTEIGYDTLVLAT